MDKKYTKYLAEDFAQDVDFINWVIKGDDKNAWDDFVRENPDQLKDINIAKSIVSSLRMNKANLRDGSEYEIFEKIEAFYTLHHQTKQTFRFKRLLQYAALIVLVLAIGAAIPTFYFTRKTDHYTEIASSSSESNEARLILANGEEIVLKDKLSDLQFNTTGNQIKIDKDSIINYKRKSTDNAMAQVIIPYGKRSSLLLSDGTKVWLNAGSKLTFPQKFSGKNRKVFLKGEAYFDVFKNKDIPFIVSSEGMNVTVHGTAFNFRNNDLESDLEVVLVEGLVTMKDNNTKFSGKEIQLIPNQKAVYDKTTSKTSVEYGVDVERYTSWKEGLLEFDRESILNVFKRLSRYYNVGFVTESSIELNKKISGKLDLKDSLEDVMKVISDVAPISFRIDQNKVIVNNKVKNMPMR